MPARDMAVSGAFGIMDPDVCSVLVLGTYHSRLTRPGSSMPSQSSAALALQPQPDEDAVGRVVASRQIARLLLGSGAGGRARHSG